nr:PIN domain-containing protein [Sphingomonas lycopersici]
MDTNVVVYAFTTDPRAAVAEKLLADGIELSAQVLNEFANVARRKLGFDWSQIEQALSAIGAHEKYIRSIWKLIRWRSNSYGATISHSMTR